MWSYPILAEEYALRFAVIVKVKLHYAAALATKKKKKKKKRKKKQSFTQFNLSHNMQQIHWGPEITTQHLSLLASPHLSSQKVKGQTCSWFQAQNNAVLAHWTQDYMYLTQYCMCLT